MSDKIIYAELNFPGLFSNIYSTDYGILFYNEIINISHDSNHAVIYDYQNNNYDEIIKKITYFYESKNITPRIYSSLILGQLNKIKNVLERNNYTVEQYINNYLIHKSKCMINEPYTLKIKRIENETELLTMNNFFDDDWNFELLQKQVKSKDFHLLIGYENDIPVSKCTIQCINKIGRVDDVETKSEYRRKGYSRQMLRYLINYNYEICDNKILYLWYSNNTAGKIYREAGFTDYVNNFESWSAYRK
jgi:GNAT superfamily N-acetyltransferase